MSVCDFMYYHRCLTNMSNLLSPEPVDNCSPPLTPSLSISSLHEIPPSTYSSVNDQFSSPLWGSSKLTFEVTPYLHPKYLLADFALPRKKVNLITIHNYYIYLQYVIMISFLLCLISFVINEFILLSLIKSSETNF
jgi:hypothetical protein